jgi:hypothetical protein
MRVNVRSDKIIPSYSCDCQYEGGKDLWQTYVYDYNRAIRLDKPYQIAFNPETLATATLPIRLATNISSWTLEYLPVDPSSSHKGYFACDTWITDKHKGIIIKHSPNYPGSYSNSMSEIQRSLLNWTLNTNYEEAFNKIGQFSSLGSNWDSYGSSSIDGNSVLNAIKLLKDILTIQKEEEFNVPAPFVTPLSDGGVQLEWEIGSKYLELSLMPGLEEITYFATEDDNCDVTSEGSLPYTEWLVKLLKWLTGVSIIRLNEIDTYLQKAA